MLDTNDIPTLPPRPRIYGVWLPLGNPNGQGWLRDKDANAFGVFDFEFAKQTAKWFGGQVLIYDEEYVNFEAQMLAAERTAKEKRHGLFAFRR